VTANETFIEWLRARRQQVGVPQQAIADHLGVPQQTIARIESGKRPVKLDEAAAIAAFFGANLDGVLAGMPPRETGTDLARARRLLAHIHTAITAEIARGQQ
jgi:transcriptional regulator with XRE-family HTH domain